MKHTIYGIQVISSVSTYSQTSWMKLCVEPIREPPNETLPTSYRASSESFQTMSSQKPSESSRKVSKNCRNPSEISWTASKNPRTSSESSQTTSESPRTTSESSWTAPGSHWATSGSSQEPSKQTFHRPHDGRHSINAMDWRMPVSGIPENHRITTHHINVTTHGWNGGISGILLPLAWIQECMHRLVWKSSRHLMLQSQPWRMSWIHRLHILTNIDLYNRSGNRSKVGVGLRQGNRVAEIYVGRHMLQCCALRGRGSSAGSPSRESLCGDFHREETSEE